MQQLATHGQELKAAHRAAAHRVTLRLFGRTRTQREHVQAANDFLRCVLEHGCESLRPW
jgi:hypothetical protein